jgi:ribosomal protein S18 acetylase RimI-like enzyme
MRWRFSHVHLGCAAIDIGVASPWTGSCWYRTCPMDTNAESPTKIIARLPVERWREYKALRLRALQSAPQAFGQSYQEASLYPDERWRQRLIDTAEGRGWNVFAERDGQLIGMTGAFQWPEDIGADRAMIVSVFVEAEARGQGVGKSLMTAVLDLIAAAGIGNAILAVNPVQTAAVRLYERMGFRATGVEVNRMGDGNQCEEVVMERPLATTWNWVRTTDDSLRPKS